MRFYEDFNFTGQNGTGINSNEGVLLTTLEFMN